MEERRWVSVREFASYLGISSDQVYRLARTDPDVRRVTRRFGGRVRVCLFAFQQLEAAMSDAPPDGDGRRLRLAK